MIRLKRAMMLAGVLFALMGSAAARTVAECEAMMKGNAYQGEWLESKGGESLKLCFSTNSLGVFSYRQRVFRYTWRSNGEGKIWLKPCDLLEAEELPPIQYDAETDTMVIDLQDGMSGIGLTGRLAAGDTGVSEPLQKMLSRPLLKPPELIDRVKKLEELKAKRPEGFKEVPSLLESMDPESLLERMVRIESVDTEYPRVEMGSSIVFSDHIIFNIIYGRYATDLNALHLEHAGERRAHSFKKNQPGCQLGVTTEAIEAACRELSALKIDVDLLSYPFGSGDTYWREDAVCIMVSKNEWKAVKEVLAKYVFSGKPAPRYILESRQTSHYYDECLKKMYDIKWESGKPVLVPRKY